MWTGCYFDIQNPTCIRQQVLRPTDDNRQTSKTTRATIQINAFLKKYSRFACFLPKFSLTLFDVEL